MLLHFATDQTAATALAAQCGMPCQLITQHRFPDGESLVTLPTPLPDRIVIFLSLHQPNDKLIELLLACKTARSLGVKQIILISPYLCYMRQDIAFTPGQAVSQHWIGELLAGLVDALITVDPHLHRVSHLEQAVPVAHAITLSAASMIGEFLSTVADAPLLVGPDAESAQWVEVVAAHRQLDHVVASKRRHGDKAVEIELPEFAYQGRHAVLVDDVISSGRTLAVAAQALLAKGCREVSAVCTHALLADDAEQTLYDAGISQLWSTDSISHTSNCIALAPLLAAALQALSQADQ